jgi:crotonobetainyl-CoA:carnitine CoA-transferase CaiB-like acyl-CoA transferase
MLQHLKVIELASVLAGPATGMFFAELGAKVIKIENPKTNGDITRQWRLECENKTSEYSAYYASVNYGKEVLFIDISTTEGQLQVKELLKDADIVICNFKSGDAEKYQLDAHSLHLLNPMLIYASISGFGQADKRTAFDVVLQAESGFMGMNGTTESGPVKMPVALIDILAAHQLKEGILLTLLQREKNKKGAIVEVSLYDAAIASLANQASNWLNQNYIPSPIGSLHPNIAPYGESFVTADNKLLVLAIGNDKQFKTLCQILNIEKIAESSLYSNNHNRVKNRTKLAQLIAKEINKFHAKKIADLLINNQVPAGIIKNLDAVFEEESAKQLILTDPIGKRVKTAIFKIKSF